LRKISLRETEGLREENLLAGQLVYSWIGGFTRNVFDMRFVLLCFHFTVLSLMSCFRSRSVYSLEKFSTAITGESRLNQASDAAKRILGRLDVDSWKLVEFFENVTSTMGGPAHSTADPTTQQVITEARMREVVHLRAPAWMQEGLLVLIDDLHVWRSPPPLPFLVNGF